MLPPEITSEIFSYLAPVTLLEASRASRAWRERTLDSRLWRQKFRSEGWGLDMNAIRRYEREYQQPRKARSRRAETHVEQGNVRKRVRAVGEEVTADSSSFLPHNSSTCQKDFQTSSIQDTGGETNKISNLERQASANDEEMQDADFLQNEATPYPMEVQTSSSTEGSGNQDNSSMTALNGERRVVSRDEIPLNLKNEQSLVRYNLSGTPQINYNHIYKQKRRLEENWESGSYQSFQLPHRDHPEEAHRECVYTIQYIGNILVSGSRDRTLRKWDLDTQRLIGKPLVGHNASVLCLQFDNSENEDIIVSGSSDTDVILWQYSTGKMIKKIARAHEESVLNLKFDSRFLVTCSKDKTIKIWNRHELRPGDRDYPIKGVEGGGACPAFILDLHGIGNTIDVDRHLTAEEKMPVPPYNPIMVLGSHNAAVNAIHIYEDQLVSASGDRHVHMWNIHTGVRTSVCRGHTKGIACVQYDGKRIVSGSSDNTIRIYDPATQAEVACLKGHTRLVRTIQSAFGDLPGSRDQLEAEAQEVDIKFLAAQRAGKIPTPSRRTRERNPGSKNPKDIMAIGARLPPGGGGSRWGRIVSGSYDETIIIWKKLSDGRWVKAHVLRQEEALRAAGGPLLSQSDVNSQAQTQPNPQTATRGFASQQPSSQNGQNPQNGHPRQDQHNTQLRSQTSHSTQVSSYNTASSHDTPLASHAQAQAIASDARAAIAGRQHADAIANVGPDIPQQATRTDLPLYQQQQMTGAITATQNGAQNIYPPQTSPPQAQHNPPPAFQPGHHRVQNLPGTQPNARVFKLQFDARRLICCSQDPKIVGWDFANGDEKIIECSPFFATPQ